MYWQDQTHPRAITRHLRIKSLNKIRKEKLGSSWSIVEVELGGQGTPTHRHPRTITRLPLSGRNTQ